MTGQQHASLRVNLNDGVMWLTKVNADTAYGISLDMWRALLAAMEQARGDPEIRAVVIDSETGFHNGAVMVLELRPSLEEITETDVREFIWRGQELGHVIAALPKPVIGLAAAGAEAGGLELLLRSDFIYTLDNASFGLPEVTLGFVPGWGGTQWGGRLMHFRKAQELLLLGESVTGRRAEELGLVTRSFADSQELDAHVGYVLDRLRNCSPAAFAGTKRCLMAIWATSLDHGERVEIEAEVDALASREFLSGLDASSRGELYDYWAARRIAK